MRLLLRSVAVALLALATPAVTTAQQGAVVINDLTSALGNSGRVLMIGAHPDDEDTNLLGWLARGARADAAYLSLTRGDGGQNAIGNELGEALGVIRTEELLAARRVDGARQFFTRAYDFGFSKTAEETYQHWPKDSVFGDVVRIVRAFRPHIIVAVFSGTPRDGHGHHQVSGMLAKEAYEASMDTIRFPVAIYGAPWTVSKFYRAARFNAANATLKMDVGGYDAVRGEGLGEIAGQSRSQHRSQGFGVSQPRGSQLDYVRREATRVNESTPAEQETAMFDGLDTSFDRFAGALSAAQRPVFDSLTRGLEMLRTQVDLRAPGNALPLLDRTLRLLDRWCTRGNAERSGLCRGTEPIASSVAPADADVFLSASRTFTHLQALGAAASGLLLEATVNREIVAEADTASLTLRITNRGTRVARVSVFTPSSAPRAPTDSIVPGASFVATIPLPSYPRSAPWWIQRRADDSLATLGNGILAPVARNGDMFVEPVSVLDDEARSQRPEASVPALVDGIPVQLTAPIVYRRIDEVRGQIDTPVMFAPRVTLTFDGGPTGYVRANAPIDRTVVVRVTANGEVDGPVIVRFLAPRGLRTDSATRTLTLKVGDEVAVSFRLRGMLPRGRFVLSASVDASVDGTVKTFATGYQRIEYEHIRPQHLYRPAAVAVEAVETGAMPTGPIGYLTGLADNVAPMLAQLGARVESIAATTMTAATLARYEVIVIGPRAFEAQPAIAARMPELQAWVRAGGTMIVQYQQTEIGKPGMAPFPMTFTRPAARVTEEDAAVRMLRANSPLLRRPNRIDASDWNGWVQERATYMPTIADSSYTSVLGMNDPGEPENRNALLTAKVGKGTYVFTTLALFRQLPAGVPGAARLFVNLLNAGQPTPAPRR